MNHFLRILIFSILIISFFSCKKSEKGGGFTEVNSPSTNESSSVEDINSERENEDFELNPDELVGYIDALDLSPDYLVEIDEEKIPVYASLMLDNVNPSGKFHGTPVSPISYVNKNIKSFPIKVNISINPKLGVNKAFAAIRPLRKNIAFNWVNDRKITFQLNEPQNLTLDISENGRRPLHLFINKKAINPDTIGKKVIYFGPGVHGIDQIKLKTNEILYVEEGALLLPSPPLTGGTQQVRDEVFNLAAPMIDIEGANNVQIMGGGIISASRAIEDGKKGGVIQAVRAGNLKIKDVLLIDSNGWNVHIQNSDHAEVDNVKVIGYYINTDGINFNGSRNSIAKNCFIHVDDDGYEVKAMNQGIDVHDIIFENCTVWNDYGTAMGVAVEVKGNIDNVIWKNMDVIRFDPVVHPSLKSFRSCLMVHAVGGGNVSNLTFEDIRIENTNTIEPLIMVDDIKKLIPDESYPNSSYNKIESIVFKDIVATNVSNPEVVVYDESDQGDLVSGITFQNVVINGDKLVSDDSRITNQNGVNVEVR